MKMIHLDKRSDALNSYKRGLEYLEKWFNYENSPFQLFLCLKLSTKQLKNIKQIVQYLYYNIF